MAVVTEGGSDGANPANRRPWLEIARLSAMLIVVMQHTPGEVCPLNHWFIGAALASFFLMSGYFSARHLWGAEASRWVRRRLRCLLIPYAFWCVLYWTLSGAPLRAGVVCEIFGLGTCPMLTPMWFVRDLILFTLISWLFIRCRMALCGLGLFCLFLPRWMHSMAWPAPYLFGDFVLGIMLAQVAPGFLKFWEHLPLSVHGAVILAGAGLVCMGSAKAQLVPSSFSGLIVAGIFSLGVIAQRMSSVWAARLAEWAEGSFFVYCFHIFVLIALIGAETLFPEAWPVWVWWGLTPGIYALCRGMYLLLRQFCPIALVVMTGGR